MKFVLLILLVVLIMSIASGVSKQYRERNILYCKILDFLNAYELNIGFKKEKIKDVVNNFESSNDMKKMLEIYKRHLNDKEEIKFQNIKILQDDEQVFLEDVFKNLGGADAETEKLQLTEIKNQIKIKVEETAKARDKYCPLIMKLSLLFALAVVILML